MLRGWIESEQTNSCSVEQEALSFLSCLRVITHCHESLFNISLFDWRVQLYLSTISSIWDTPIVDLWLVPSLLAALGSCHLMHFSSRMRQYSTAQRRDQQGKPRRILFYTWEHRTQCYCRWICATSVMQADISLRPIEFFALHVVFSKHLSCTCRQQLFRLAGSRPDVFHRDSTCLYLFALLQGLTHVDSAKDSNKYCTAYFSRKIFTETLSAPMYWVPTILDHDTCRYYTHINKESHQIDWWCLWSD